jgi:predicted PurR-regulated permease PerM
VQNSKAARLVRILEATVLIIATLYFGRPILLPIVAAILITFLLSPPIAWLERRRVPRPAAVMTVVVLLFSIFGAIVWKATTQLSELVVQLPQYEDTLRTKLKDLQGSESSTLRKVGKSIDKLSNEIKESVSDNEKVASSKSEPTPVRIVADPTTPIETANVAISSIAGPLASIGVLTVLVIFMSMVREDLRDRLVRLAGTNQVTLTTRTLDELGTRISRYLLMNAMINGGFGLTLGLGLFAMGVQYAALWGLLAAMLRFIP